MLNANDVFTLGRICIVIDFIENGEVFLRRWIDDTFNGFYRLPVAKFLQQLADATGIAPAA